MIRYQIDSAETGLAIRLTDVAGKQDRLLAAFGDCQEGHCSCPTDEYSKVEAMDVVPAADTIEIRLEAKPGTAFDAAAIAACLDYTIEQTAKPEVAEASAE